MTRTSVPVEHRTFLGLDRRLLWPTAGILAVVLLFAWVLPMIASSLDHEEPIPPGTVLEVGSGVTFTPADGWAIDLDSSGGGTITVINGAVSYSVRVGQWSGELDEFITEVNAEVEDRFDFRIHGDQTSIVTNQGVTGVGEAFLGDGIEGRLYGFVDSGLGAEIIASGPEGSVGPRLDDIEKMVATLTFGGEAS